MSRAPGPSTSERLATLEEQNRHQEEHIGHIEETLDQHGVVLARIDKGLNGELDKRMLAIMRGYFGELATRRDETRKRIALVSTIVLSSSAIITSVLLAVFL